jgi:hypothetical protein
MRDVISDLKVVVTNIGKKDNNSVTKEQESPTSEKDEGEGSSTGAKENLATKQRSKLPKNNTNQDDKTQEEGMEEELLNQEQTKTNQLGEKSVEQEKDTVVPDLDENLTRNKLKPWRRTTQDWKLKKKLLHLQKTSKKVKEQVIPHTREIAGVETLNDADTDPKELKESTSPKIIFHVKIGKSRTSTQHWILAKQKRNPNKRHLQVLEQRNHTLM